MMRAWNFALLVVALAIPQSAWAGNWTVFTRWFYSSPTYGCNPHAGLQDCMMPWHPIQSSMHYNVLPPGMHRPWPLMRPTPSLAPHTPDFTAAGFRAAGQRTWGIPCRNRYCGPTPGCSYYGNYPWNGFRNCMSKAGGHTGYRADGQAPCACAATPSDSDYLNPYYNAQPVEPSPVYAPDYYAE